MEARALVMKMTSSFVKMTSSAAAVTYVDAITPTKVTCTLANGHAFYYAFKRTNSRARTLACALDMKMTSFAAAGTYVDALIHFTLLSGWVCFIFLKWVVCFIFLKWVVCFVFLKWVVCFVFLFLLTVTAACLHRLDHRANTPRNVQIPTGNNNTTLGAQQLFRFCVSLMRK